MILYDLNCKLLGISDDSLALLGYKNFNEFSLKQSDVNELFIIKDYEEASTDTHFLKLIISKDNFPPTKAMIKTEKNDNIEVYVSVNKFNFANNIDFGYAVSIVKPSNSSINFQTKELSNKSCSDGLQKYNTAYIIDEKWLIDSAKYLDINIEDLEIFLAEFIKSAREKEEILHESLIAENKVMLYSIISFLRDPAKTLNIKPIIFALDNLENSDKFSAPNAFADFQHTLNSIDNFLKKRNEL